MQNTKLRKSKICNLSILSQVLQERQSAIRNTQQWGFTLLEIMIALAITGITVTILLHTVNYHADIMYENILTTEMYQLAKEKMYDLEQTRKNSKGNLKITGLTYENIIIRAKDSSIVELKTIVQGHDREVILNELLLKRGKSTKIQ